MEKIMCGTTPIVTFGVAVENRDLFRIADRVAESCGMACVIESFPYFVFLGSYGVLDSRDNRIVSVSDAISLLESVED